MHSTFFLVFFFFLSFRFFYRKKCFLNICILCSHLVSNRLNGKIISVFFFHYLNNDTRLFFLFIDCNLYSARCNLPFNFVFHIVNKSVFIRFAIRFFSFFLLCFLFRFDCYAKHEATQKINTNKQEKVNISHFMTFRICF